MGGTTHPRPRGMDGRCARGADHGRRQRSPQRRSRRPGSAAHRHPRLYHDGRPRHQVVRLPAGKTHMPTDTRLNLTPQFVMGVCLILFGALLTLDRLQLVDAAVSLRFWPVVLIALGGWIVIEQARDGTQLAGLRDDRRRRPAAPELARHRARAVLGAVLAAHHRAGRRAPDHADARAHGATGTASTVRDTRVGRGALRLRSAAQTERSTCSRCSGAASARATTSHSAAAISRRSSAARSSICARPSSSLASRPSSTSSSMMGGHEVWVPSGWTVVLEVMPILGRRRGQAAAGARPGTAPPNEARAATGAARRRRAWAALTIKN